MKRGLLLAFALCGLTLAIPADAASAPNAYQAGRAARLAGRLDEAERLLRQAVTASPKHHLALYNLGLLYEARARTAPRGPQKLKMLEIAAGWLERARVNLNSGVSAPDYTVFNTLGFIYIQAGSLTAAEQRLNEGLQYKDKLSSESQGKLYSNLGYVVALRGDAPAAQKYLKEGATRGNPNATANLNRLRTVKAN